MLALLRNTSREYGVKRGVTFAKLKHEGPLRDTVVRRSAQTGAFVVDLTESPGFMIEHSSQRRRFFAAIVNSIQAIIGGIVAVLLGGAVAGPSFQRRRESWLPAGSLDALNEGEPTPVTLRVARQDGYTQTVERQVVFLVKSGDSVKALSSTCTHLGCRVSWDAEAKQLKCPCHGGVYDKTGAVIAGPPPAPLPSLMTRIDGDQVLIQA